MILRYLYDKMLMEIFDFNNIKSLPFSKVNSNHYVIEDDDKIDVRFGETTLDLKYFKAPKLFDSFDGEGVINVSYSFNDVDSQYKKSTLEDSLPILKGVVSVSIDYVESNNPNVMIIFSADRSGKLTFDAGKDRVCKLLVKKYCPSDYGVVEIGVAFPTGLMLYNKQFLKKMNKN